MDRDGRAYRDYEFNLRELGGALGDLGTLFPLALGLIVVNGMDPVAVFCLVGLTNLVTGLVYRLPMPVEPKKVVSAVAISQAWPASVVVASGLGLGVLWLALAFSGVIRRLARITPLCLVRGIQLALGFALARQAWRMVAPDLMLGAVSIALILLLRRSRRLPAALAVVGLGVVLMALRGDLSGRITVGLSLPRLALPSMRDMWQGMVGAGVAQIPLTLTNAVLATSAIIAELFPDKRVSEDRLLLNMGIMNIVSALFGGMPMCHGSGGLAAQYYFGARTGGANVLEGLLELALGLLLGGSLVALLSAFPLALLGGMLGVVGISMGIPATRLTRWSLGIALLTAAVSMVTNMALGYLAGLLGVYLVRWLVARGTIAQGLAEDQVDPHADAVTRPSN